ncbi:MAG TPA: MaoC family dehydratase [Alphaproteobacteria bacterium]|nr:MaoC family dehydratase [Alphaproteobacteria bacterium]
MTIDPSAEQYLQNLKAFARRAGSELGTSRWMKVSQRQIDQFAECTGDRQWIHVDLERARHSPLGSTIAHGYLLLALIAPSAYEVWIDRLGAPQILNYGLDGVRFIAPVRAEARIRNRIKLLAVEDRGGGGWLIKTENTIEIEGEAKPAVVATTLALVGGA